MQQETGLPDLADNDRILSVIFNLYNLKLNLGWQLKPRPVCNLPSSHVKKEDISISKQVCFCYAQRPNVWCVHLRQGKCVHTLNTNSLRVRMKKLCVTCKTHLTFGWCVPYVTLSTPPGMTNTTLDLKLCSLVWETHKLFFFYFVCSNGDIQSFQILSVISSVVGLPNHVQKWVITCVLHGGWFSEDRSSKFFIWCTLSDKRRKAKSIK